MSYREYVPTCVETLFGRPPTKFKARAIIPESQTLNLDSGRCKCCTCEKNRSQRNARNLREDYASNDMRYKCIMNCPDCRKQVKKKEHIVPYNERAAEKRRYKDRRRNRRVDHSCYECYCVPQYDYTDEEYYPDERAQQRCRHKTTKNKNYSSEPSRSTDSPDYSDSDRFCDVCQNWVRSDSKEERGIYSCKMYECVEDGTASHDRCAQGIHFIVERCKFCGNRRDGPTESGKKGEEHCQTLQSIVQTEGICELGREIEKCSRGEDFYKIKEVDEKLIRPIEKEKDSCEEIYEKFVKQLAALERYPEIPKDEDLIQENRPQDVLNSNEDPSPNWEFKKAHSTSEISNVEKQNKNYNDNLEDYKQQLMAELNEESGEKSPQNNDFHNCNCEYARRDWKAETQNKMEPDKSELRLLKQKCDEALGQLELFKREIAVSKQEKCHCDMESTMCIVEDCKHKCAQLEKQVIFLQHTIDCYTRPKPGNTEGNKEIRRPHRAAEKQKKQEHTNQSNSRRRDPGREVITANVKVSRKPKSTCSPARVRNMTCTHIRCFPREQIADIPAFKMCSGYQGAVNKR